MPSRNKNFKCNTRGKSLVANRIRSINNSSTIDRIARLTTPQITKNLFENNFFNGTKFHDYKFPSQNYLFLLKNIDPNLNIQIQSLP